MATSKASGSGHRVGIDLDGVLYNFGSALRDYLVEYHGWKKEWCPPPMRWEFYEDWGLTLAGFKNLCNAAADARRLWNNRIITDGRDAVYALRDLKEAGHTIHIITHRGFGSHPGVSAEETAKWLNAWDVPYDTLTFSGDKTIIKTDFMIEDNIDNYFALQASGCRSVFMDRPWNREAGGIRVKSIREFTDLVLESK